MWVGAFGIMLVSTLIPPIVDGDATILDMENPLSILCYWVIPFTRPGHRGRDLRGLPALVREAIGRGRPAIRGTSAVVPQAPPPTDMATDQVRIDAPADSRMDEPFGVRIDLSAAGTRTPTSATVTTSGQDLYGHLWRARADVVVPPSGAVDLSVAAPSSADSDWTTADPGAPIWAMTFADEDGVPEVFIAPTEPWQVTIEVHAAGGVIARRTVLRRGADPGVRYEPTLLDGLPGDAGAARGQTTDGRLARGGLLRRLGGRRTNRSSPAPRCSRRTAMRPWRRPGYPAPTPRPGSARCRWNDLPLRCDCSPAVPRLTRHVSRRWRLSRGSEGLLATLGTAWHRRRER